MKKPFLPVMAVLFVFSCAPKAVERPVPPAHPGQSAVIAPAQVAVTVETLKSAFILNGVDALMSEITAEVIRNGVPAGVFEGILVYKRPGFLRLRLFGPLGITAAEVFLRGNALQVYIPVKNTLYEGEVPAMPETLPEDLLYAMEQDEGGYEPLRQGGYTLYSFRQAPDAGAPVELKGKYIYGKNPLLNTALALYRDGKKTFGFSFEDFQEAGGKVIPATIKVSTAYGIGMNLRLIEPSVNNEIGEEFFEPIDREGLDVRPLRELPSAGTNRGGL